MTVGKVAPRRAGPTKTGCGQGDSVYATTTTRTPKTPKAPARTPVSTGCGSSSSTGGWKAKTVTSGKSGKTTGLSERAKKELEKAKTNKAGGRGRVSTGCGNSEPAKPSKPAKPVKPAPLPDRPNRTGC